MVNWEGLMSLRSRLEPRGMDVPMKETTAGKVFSIIVSLISMSVLAVCLSRRVQRVRDWGELPFVSWLVLLIYLDSIAFVAGTAVLAHGFGLGSNAMMCSRAILLCLSCYMTTKVVCDADERKRIPADVVLKLLYYFLVERVFIVRRSSKPRLRDPLYLFNSFGMLAPYMVVIILNFYFRFSTFENGTCMIGMKRVAMIPLIAFDVFVNVYLTSLFLIPLRATWSYQNNRTSSIRTIALRTFIGSCATLLSSIVNLTFAAVLNGEPGWVCLMCCNCDILFSVLVLHWITSKDKPTSIISGPSKVKFKSSPHKQPRLTSHTDVMAYQTKLREQRRSRGFVTTLVSVAHEEEDFDKITYPDNVITVERTHTIEVSEVDDDENDRRSSSHLQNLD